LIRTPAERPKYARHEFFEEKWVAIERVGGALRHYLIARADSLRGEI
jgi:hypothetical protein